MGKNIGQMGSKEGLVLCHSLFCLGFAVFFASQGLFLSTIWVCYFALLSAFAYSYVWLLVLRALVGFGIAASPQAYAI